MPSIKMRRFISLLLAVFLAIPIWQLSGYLLWGIASAFTTFLLLDITLTRVIDVKIKIALLIMYIISMIGVLAMLFTQVL